MTKKRNNPWYYYNDGVLVKEKKPAMPGDLVLIDRMLTSNCLFTIVKEVHMGGFHDQYGQYFKWNRVYKASKVLDELSNLRTYKEKHQCTTTHEVEELKKANEWLKEDLRVSNEAYDLLSTENNRLNDELTKAWTSEYRTNTNYMMLQDDMADLQRNKQALIDDLEACIKLLSDPIAPTLEHAAYCDGQLDALKAILSKVTSGYHLPTKSSTTK